ncbi:hypothetical protein K466DRAFT_592514 [Polyporus arcularius HHB13444]|uniref:Uncharacterized protein n=1 Tax=Polyporus arcularius HHB13444 TaxID=1314778 RepID=A0A5C3NQ59_9APHY|nr:hypothetical protein K466DRAFT_592514 [Polyporus arcularius HHB13444]
METRPTAGAPTSVCKVCNLARNTSRIPRYRSHGVRPLAAAARTSADAPGTCTQGWQPTSCRHPYDPASILGCSATGSVLEGTRGVSSGVDRLIVCTPHGRASFGRYVEHAQAAVQGSRSRVCLRSLALDSLDGAHCCGGAGVDDPEHLPVV